MRVKFYPQAWINDEAVEVDADGPTTFDIPDAEVRWDSPGSVGSLLSDDFKTHPNAPAWVKRWRGPFDIRPVEYPS